MKTIFKWNGLDLFFAGIIPTIGALIAKTGVNGLTTEMLQATLSNELGTALLGVKKDIYNSVI